LAFVVSVTYKKLVRATPSVLRTSEDGKGTPPGAVCELASAIVAPAGPPAATENVAATPPATGEVTVSPLAVGRAMGEKFDEPPHALNAHRASVIVTVFSAGQIMELPRPNDHRLNSCRYLFHRQSCVLSAVREPGLGGTNSGTSGAAGTASATPLFNLGGTVTGALTTITPSAKSRWRYEMQRINNINRG
jgi:hypothetical protein